MVTRHEVFSPLPVEECANRLRQNTRAGWAVRWPFRDSAAAGSEGQMTDRREVVGTVTRDGFVLQRTRTANPAFPTIANGRFRPVPEGTLIELSLG